MLQAPLATNSISTLVVNDFVRDECGQYVSIILHRRVPEEAKGYRTLQPSILPDGPPLRLPSSLPLAGTVQLTVAVKDLLGEGRCGSVYSTSLSRLLEPSNNSLDVSEPGLPFLPSLVIKVADQAHLKDLANEASMYDEMETLQGVAIPYCYGWFDSELDRRWTIPSTSAEPTNLFRKNSMSTRLSLLLLERVGELLPLGDRLPDRSDIWAIFSDLSRLGIDQPDMRYSNILTSSELAISTQGISLPGKLCPYHHCVHKYRAVDFDRARRTDWTLKQHYYQQVGTLGRLLEMMEMNVVLEPWEY